MFRNTLVYQALAFAGVFGLSVTQSDAAVAKSKQKGAGKSHSIIAALEASNKAGELVPTLEGFAEMEAEILEGATNTRMEIWKRVWSAYAFTDFPHLERYPEMVRHAFAKKFGLNMAISQKDWSDDQKKLYDSFCSTQTRPFQLFIDLAREGNKGEGQHSANGTQKVLDLLNGSGTLPAKVTAAKVLLGKPARKRGADQQRNDAPDAQQFKAGETPTIGAPVDGKKWDITDLKKKTPVEVCIVLVATMPFNDVMQLVQACGKRLATSTDGLDKLAAERLATAVNEYLTKNAG